MKVSEIFYSLQGEGYHSGTPAVFVRLAGCNLSCPFCDTATGGGTDLSEQSIAKAVDRYPARLVVVTGGEPSLQLTSTLVDLLHEGGKYVAVETNGTHPLPAEVDWITLSPKDPWLGDAARPVLAAANELKVVFDGGHEPQGYPHISISHARFLQPCDTGDPVRNAAIATAAAQYIMAHPQWRLSLQTHKIIGIQ